MRGRIAKLSGEVSKRTLQRRARSLKAPRASDMHAPEELDDVARTEWDRLAPMLREMRQLSDLDRRALGIYCAAYSDFRRATQALNKPGAHVVRNKMTGAVKQSPWIGIRHTASVTMLSVSQRLGLTPADRIKFDGKAAADAAAAPKHADQVPGATTAEDLDEFLADGIRVN